MRLPFTIDQFLDVFSRYNVAVWPAQWGLAAIQNLALIPEALDRGTIVPPHPHGGDSG